MLKGIASKGGIDASSIICSAQARVARWGFAGLNVVPKKALHFARGARGAAKPSARMDRLELSAQTVDLELSGWLALKPGTFLLQLRYCGIASSCLRMRACAVESLSPNARAEVEGAVLADGHLCVARSGAEVFMSPSVQLLLKETAALDLCTGVIYDMRLYSENHRRAIEPRLQSFCGSWCSWSWSCTYLLPRNATALVSQSFGPYDCRLTLKSQGAKRPRLSMSRPVDVLITTLDALEGVVIFARLQDGGVVLLTRDSRVANLGVAALTNKPLCVELMWRKFL